MNDNIMRQSPVRRILVAVDASQSSLAALNTAVDLAARFEATVLGLFVEDINLLRLAELPFAREVSFYNAQVRRLRPADMELQLRIQAARLRDTLARTAQRFGVPWEFRTARGAVGAEVLAAGAEADLVVIGKIGRSLPGRRRSGSTVRTLLMQRRGMTLVMQTRVSFGRAPVAAVYDGSEAADKTLHTAVYLAASHKTSLMVFVVGSGAAEVEARQREAAQKLPGAAVDARFRRIANPSLSELAMRIHRETYGPVVIPCMEDWFAAEKLCGLVDEITNPVLLIR